VLVDGASDVKLSDITLRSAIRCVTGRGRKSDGISVATRALCDVSGSSLRADLAPRTVNFDPH